jgi:phosphatidylglycerophosphate synthase
MTAVAAADDGPVGAYGAALARLTSHQKTSKGAPAYSRFVNRPLGRRAAALAYTLGRTPNQVTAVSAVFTFSAIAVLALVRPSVPVAVLVSGLLVVGYALDAADGQLARLRGGGSAAGEWLDHVLDAGKTSALHAAVLVSFFRFTSLSDATLLVPLLFMVLGSTWFFAVVLTDQIRRAHPADAAGAAAARPVSTVRALLALPSDYGVLCLVFLLLAWTDVFVVVYGLMLAGQLVIFSAAVRSWFRELSRFGKPVRTG